MMIPVKNKACEEAAEGVMAAALAVWAKEMANALDSGAVFDLDGSGARVERTAVVTVKGKKRRVALAFTMADWKNEPVK